LPRDICWPRLDPSAGLWLKARNRPDDGHSQGENHMTVKSTAGLSRRQLLAIASAATLPMPAIAQTNQAPGVTDTEILLGQTMPYSGPASSYGVIGHTEMAYFNMINEQGGINGRKIRMLTLDDGYSPPKTVELTRRLVEQDQVACTFGALGTPTNLAVRKYLNQKKVPQLFVATGASQFGDRENYPWTIGWQPNYQIEAQVYAKYILQEKPNAKIAVLYQNDDSGKDYFKGFKEGLGAKASQITAAISYEVSDPTIDSQILQLKETGADVLFQTAIPKFIAMGVRKVFDIGWKPMYIISSTGSSVSSGIMPAGPEKAIGLLTGAYLKDPSDQQWFTDPAYVTWLAFIKKYYPEADIADINTVYGYSVSQTMVQTIKQCGNDLSRENLLKQATSLNLNLPMFQPGVSFATAPDNYYGIRKLRLQRFDGKAWIPFGTAVGA
jgi:branched-chain amino acid transport system substrate-binding protein